MVVDDDFSVEPECDNEETGAGKSLGAETDEGDSVLADQFGRSSGEAVSESYHSVNQQASVAADID